ncbi:MAG: mechanosensitive ion channel family protein [Dehalococcoidia bacterium]
MTWLETSVGGNSLARWMLAAGVVLVTCAALLLVRRTVRRRASRLLVAEASAGQLVAALAGSTRLLPILLLSTYAGLLTLDVAPNFGRIAKAGAVIGLLAQSAVWGNEAIGFWVARYRRDRLATDSASVTTLGAIGLLARVAMWSIIVLLILDNVGIRVTAIVAGLGIGGIAVALAAQSVLADLFASLAIVMDKPFLVGDFIVVGDRMGVVENVGLKTTRIRSLSGEQLIFSNTDILQSRLQNYQRMEERRVLFLVDVTYETPAEQLEDIPRLLRESVERQDGTRFDRAHLARFASSAVQFEVVYFVLDPDYNRYMDIHEQINFEIFRRFAERRIDFAYPTTTVRLVPPAAMAGAR